LNPQVYSNIKQLEIQIAIGFEQFYQQEDLQWPKSLKFK